MFSLTETAARQVLAEAARAGVRDPLIRVAAKRSTDGSIDYAMGFDALQASDTSLSMHGVTFLVAATSVELLSEAVLDYVQMDDGEYRFIFMNPEDPHYVPPRPGDSASAGILIPRQLSRRAIIINAQRPIEHRHGRIGDAILDRIAPSD